MNYKQSGINKRKQIISYLLIMALLLPMLPLRVQADDDHVRLEIFVVDRTNNPLMEAVITITDGETILNENTDESGKCIVELEKGRNWHYSAELSGYNAITDGWLDLSQTTYTIILLPAEIFIDIMGTVRDYMNQPIEGAAVQLQSESISQGETREYLAYTDSNGCFALSDVVKNYGDYNITVSKDGYSSLTQMFDYDNTDYVLNILIEDDTFQFEQRRDVFELTYGTGTYQNRAMSQNREGDITYRSYDESIASVDRNGIVTINNIGEVMISATISSDNTYKEKTICYTLNIQKGIQAEFGFERTEAITLNVFDTYKNTASGGTGDGEIIYSSSNPAVAEVDPVDGTVTAKSSGKAVITAFKSGKGLYEDVLVSYDIIVLKVDQEGLIFEISGDILITYSEGLTISNPVVGGGSTDESIQYNITAMSENVDNIAAYDTQNDLVIIKKPGTIRVTATKGGNEIYKPVTGLYHIKIYKMNQEELTFEKPDSEIDFEPNYVFQNSASGGSTEMQIRYSSSDESVATVD
ncbi:MAG: carboxypeptidase regulatory-like domain-containing protein, partial [Lachnospiraceae bacterium]|nr:carboxypeptidase regulatory-like domain-containing protein [Lachnospiraceae bacterium]